MITIGIDAARAFVDARTGTEEYAYEVLRHLPLTAGTDVVLYVKRMPPKHAIPPAMAEKIRVLRWPFPSLWHQGRLSLEMIGQPPDILFVPAHTLPLLHPRQSVVTVHDIGFEENPELYSHKELLYHRWALRFSIRHAVRIITVSSFTKQRLAQRFPQYAAKLRVIPLGFSPAQDPGSLTEAAVSEALRRYRIPTPYLLFVGRLQAKKNTPRLIRAWSRLRERGYPHALVLAGVPGAGYERVRKELQASPFASEIIQTGYVAADDKPLLYRGAAVFAFPSLYEGFGIPVLEAMAYGTPVVAANRTALPEVAGDAARFCDPEDTESITDALEDCLRNTQLRETLIERGKRRFRAFSWSTCAGQTREVLLEHG